MAIRLLSSLVCGALLLSSTLATPVTTSAQPSIKHVLLRESEGYHDEVWAPFLADLASSPHIKTTFSRHYHRWNMPNITDRIPFVNPPTLQGFGTSHKTEFPITPEAVLEKKVDYILTISCDADFYWRPAEYQRLFHETDVKLLCVNHDTHNVAGAIKQYRDVTKLWIDANRIIFLVLSEHVGKNLQKQLAARGSKPVNYEVYVPVMDLPQGIETERAEDKEKAFVIQGNFESGRRDYNKVFQHLRDGLAALPAGTTESEKPKLVLIGSGKKLEIPQDLTKNVDMHMNLEYPEFYKTLGKSAVLLPAFGGPAYYTEKASSTINAAIIGGTVIIGNQTMLNAYTFLNDKIVFNTNPGESDVQAAIRYLSLDQTTRNDRLKYIREYRHQLIRQNRALLEELVNPSAVASQASNKSTKAMVGQYFDAAKSIPAEHPHSSGAGFVVFLGLILAFIFRRSLVRQYKSIKGQYFAEQTAERDYIPVSMSNTPVMRAAN
ncbi:uncharacterized protein UTRI_05196_B [Ustilago trichophora]|uniref:Uncharacterized protein n=1 Tax=Ustilago trichophora TaxID=86804 RepID=A0A5C3EN62_9BASI|nr:uncharacterized protein UTRI_05196_B [Ustilago trichophora]